MMIQATLKSNGGESQFRIELTNPVEYACEAGFEAAVDLRGSHWDGDHYFPVSTSIVGLWVQSSELIKLRDHVRRWTNQPLNRLNPEDLESTFKLATLPGQRLTISFAPEPEGVSSLNPFVSVAFSAGNLKGEFCFLTDQSCLTIFVQELSVRSNQSDTDI